VYESSSFSTFSPAFICCLFDNSYSSWGFVYILFWFFFFCISLMINGELFSLIYLLAIFMSFKKCLLHIFFSLWKVSHGIHDKSKPVSWAIIMVYFYFFLLFVYSHVCTLFGSFLPSAPHSHLPTPSPLVSRQNLFRAFLQFHWGVEISNNKKDIAFLLVAHF
jgi:hypothetical protein